MSWKNEGIFSEEAIIAGLLICFAFLAVHTINFIMGLIIK
jgi:hypothetical protein